MRLFFKPHAGEPGIRLQANLPPAAGIHWLAEAARNTLLGLPGPYHVAFGCSYDGPDGKVCVAYQGPLNTTRDMLGLARQLVLLATTEGKAQ
jgi:hypothetical protein